MDESPSVFTPLRVALISAIILANIAAFLGLIMPEVGWAEMTGLFGIVFIMMFVFVILLELTWLHHRGKVYTQPAIRKQYKMAKLVYLILLILGVLMGLLVLL